MATAKAKKQWYVTATDKFLSGWGKASGKTHKIIVVCKDFDQARKVKSNMQDDRTLKYVNITDVEPRYSSKKYTTNFIKAADAPLWNK